MQHKTCFKCFRELPLNEFYRHPSTGDGHLGKCKDCARSDVRENRRKKIDKYREYDVVRAKSPKRKRLAVMVQRRYRAENPERYAANQKLARAVKAGKIRRLPCEACGRADSHGHHDDYSKPLEVRWLCPVHHKQAHKEPA